MRPGPFLYLLAAATAPVAADTPAPAPCPPPEYVDRFVVGEVKLDPPVLFVSSFHPDLTLFEIVDGEAPTFRMRHPAGECELKGSLQGSEVVLDAGQSCKVAGFSASVERGFVSLSGRGFSAEVHMRLLGLPQSLEADGSRARVPGPSTCASRKIRRAADRERCRQRGNEVLCEELAHRSWLDGCWCGPW